MKQKPNCNHLSCHHQYRRLRFWPNLHLVLACLALVGFATAFALLASSAVSWTGWSDLVLGLVVIPAGLTLVLCLVDRHWSKAAAYGLAILAALATGPSWALISGDRPWRESLASDFDLVTADVVFTPTWVVIMTLATVSPWLVYLVDAASRNRRQRDLAGKRVAKQCLAIRKADQKAAQKADQKAAQRVVSVQP